MLLLEDYRELVAVEIKSVDAMIVNYMLTTLIVIVRHYLIS